MALATTSITEAANNGGGTWKDYGTGGGSASNTDVFLTSTGSRARKVSNGVKGFAFEVNASGVDLSAQVISIRHAVLAGVGALNTRTNGGVYMVVEDTSGNESYWDLDGNDTYSGGWKVSAVSMATTPSRNNGTAATLSAVRYVGIIWDETASVGGGDPNCYIDQILYWPITGVVVTGDSTAFIDDLVDTLDAPANGPYGLWERRSGVVFSKARLVLNPGASDFAETDRTLVLENPVYDAGATIDSTIDEIGIESIETTDTITFTRCSVVSAEPDETVTTDANREFDFTSADNVTFDTCTVEGFNGTVTHLGATLNSFDGTTFKRCGELSSTGATINDGFIRDSLAAAGDTALIWNVNADPDGDLDNLFVNKGAAAHHAVQFTATAPTTVTMRGMTATGFNAADGNNDSTFEILHNTPNDVTINVVGGTGNFTCEESGTATCTVVIDPVDATVTVVDNVTRAAIEGAIVRAWAVTTTPSAGPFDPASVSITRSGSTATVTHTAHPYVTNDVVRIAGVGTSANEYNGFKTITVTGVNTYTFTVSGTPATPAPGAPTSSLLILNDNTNASGVVTDQRTYTSDQAIEGWARKSTSSPVYQTGSIGGVVDSAAGFTTTLGLVSDE